MEKLYVTIDTEPDCDTHWRRSSPLTFTSVTKGIPLFLRPIWNEFQIKPIYFVSPEVIQNEFCCKILSQELENGAIIGSHLHSEYIEPNKTMELPDGKPSLEYPCFAHEDKIEYEKIKNLTELIQLKLGVRPTWYRAARYGADLNTILSLKKLGYQYDSSVTPHIDWSSSGGPNHSMSPLQPYWISTNNFYQEASQEQSVGIMEIPITIGNKRWGKLGHYLPNKWLFFNWLRPTHVTFYEQKKLIQDFRKKFTHPTWVMMFHSMEIIPGKTPFVRTKLEQTLYLKRLRKTLSYILLGK